MTGDDAVNQADPTHCPPALLSGALETVGADDERGLAEIDRLLADYPADARLHFLKGSVLAGVQRYPEARGAMRQAVALAPGFAIARFQLGLLELSSGEAEAASATWGPLGQLPADDPLRLFAEGLRCLAADDFEGAIRLLREGIALNEANPAINRDMQLVIGQAEAAIDAQAASEEPSSLTHFALQQFAARSTKH